MRGFKRLSRLVRERIYKIDGGVYWCFGRDYFNLRSLNTSPDNVIQWDDTNKCVCVYIDSIFLRSFKTTILDLVNIHNIYNIEFMNHIRQKVISLNE